MPLRKSSDYREILNISRNFVSLLRNFFFLMQIHLRLFENFSILLSLANFKQIRKYSRLLRLIVC